MSSVLDACCGSKMFWFDPNDSRAVFVDNRRETAFRKQMWQKVANALDCLYKMTAKPSDIQLPSERHSVFSPCRVFRYTLWREWTLPSGMPYLLPLKRQSEYVQFIGLNPSTADETNDDPTVRRCIDFAKRWGFGAMCMTNAFAFRATDPDVMKGYPYPKGEKNYTWLKAIALNAGLVIAAWGKDGRHMEQDESVIRMLRFHHVKIHCLGINHNGTPKHPLYLLKTANPIPL